MILWLNDDLYKVLILSRLQKLRFYLRIDEMLCIHCLLIPWNRKSCAVSLHHDLSNQINSDNFLPNSVFWVFSLLDHWRLEQTPIAKLLNSIQELKSNGFWTFLQKQEIMEWNWEMEWSWSPNKRPKWLGFSYPEELRNNCEKSSESHSESHSESFGKSFWDSFWKSFRKSI